MTAKKATKKALPVKKAPTKKAAPKKQTAAQRNLAAFKLLETIVAKVDTDDFCSEGKDIIYTAAKIVGSKRFTSGSVDYELYSSTVFFDNLEEGDEFRFDLKITNLRTGESVNENDIGANYCDVSIES